jgi:ATP-dependent DNA helicase PIF1
MLLCNLNQNKGLCNGTRLLVTQLGQRILHCVVLRGSNVGEEVLIPRIALNTTDVKWPFTLQRHQFLVCLCYAMTINKRQGKTLSRVGLYLKRPVFTHGQLYVAVSRSAEEVLIPFMKLARVAHRLRMLFTRKSLLPLMRLPLSPFPTWLL